MGRITHRIDRAFRLASSPSEFYLFFRFLRAQLPLPARDHFRPGDEIEIRTDEGAAHHTTVLGYDRASVRPYDPIHELFMMRIPALVDDAKQLDGAKVDSAGPAGSR